MSNTNPILVRILTLGGICTLSACSMVPAGQDPVRPYRREAEKVVSSVELHTSLGWRCRRVGALVVEAGITARMASSMGERRHAALVGAVASAEWDRLACPAAAVPGLSFGTADAVKQMANRAHKTTGLL